MKKRSITTLAAAGLLAATLIGGNVGTASASVGTRASATYTFTASSTGYGSTLQAAEYDARNQLYATYGGCGPWRLADSSQHADGTWEATINAECSSYK
jgi:hypothetical protein